MVRESQHQCAPKVSAFVFIINNGRVYFVRNEAGSVGVPGGKREGGEDPFTVACRETKEETGCSPPYSMAAGGAGVAYYTTAAGRFYPSVMYEDRSHQCHYYWLNVSDQVADELYVGPSPDPMGGEVSVFWGDPLDLWPDIRYHIQRGLMLLAAVGVHVSVPERRRRPKNWGRPRVSTETRRELAALLDVSCTPKSRYPATRLNPLSLGPLAEKT